MSTVAADLRAAAEVLRRDGWTQGDWGPVGGCRCAAGAIVTAIKPDASKADDLITDDDAFGRWDRAEDALLDIISSYAIGPWNDAPGRTADEVIAALEAAAAVAEAEQ